MLLSTVLIDLYNVEMNHIISSDLHMLMIDHSYTSECEHSFNVIEIILTWVTESLITKLWFHSASLK